MRIASRPILMVMLAAWSVPVSSFSQNILSIRVKGGWNTYAMPDLKMMQNSIAGFYRSNGIAAKAVEQFPPYFSLQGQFAASVQSTRASKTNLGVFFEILSTGGRVHYRDYSGEIRFDQLLSGLSLGTFVETEVKQSKQLSWLFALENSLIFSELENTQILRIGRDRLFQKVAFNSTSIAMQPRITPVLMIGSTILGVHIGYQFSFSSSLRLSTDDRVFWIDEKNKKIKVNWRGMRFGILVGYNFQQHKPRKQ